MADKLLFENNFVEEEIKAVKLLEQLNEDSGNGVVQGNEPNHNGSDSSDIAQPAAKVGFAKATLSRTLPAMIGYTQPLNGPTGYIFAFRPKGNSGSTKGTGTHSTNTNDPDNIEYQGTNGEVGPGQTSPGPTTISVTNPISNNTADDFMIARKLVTTNMREVKIDITNEVEQDVVALFGNNFYEKYIEFMDPSTEGKIDKIAGFFFEFATTQMVKKTNSAFVSYLNGVATPLGTAPITSSDDLIFALAQMQAKLYGAERKKVAGRTWAICAPDVASAISTSGEIFGGHDKEDDLRDPTSIENTFVCALGNLDVYSSADLADGEIVMGILGNANVSSIYYSPYNEYMIAGGADPYTGISNVFFRVRDDWTTNPLDTFNKTQPTPSTTPGNPEYPEINVTEGPNSDYIVKGTLTLPVIFT